MVEQLALNPGLEAKTLLEALQRVLQERRAGAMHANIVPCVVRDDVRMSDAEKAKAAANGITVIVQPAALVHVNAPPSAQELDDAMRELRRCEAAAVGSLWDLGRALWRIFEPRLYLARHRKWGEFLFAEVGMDEQAARRLMAVSCAFDRATVEELGPARLVLALRCPEERRAELLARARSGLSATALAREAERMGLLPRGEDKPGKCRPRATVGVPLGRHSVQLGRFTASGLRGGLPELLLPTGLLRFQIITRKQGIVLIVEATASKKKKEKR